MNPIPAAGQIWRNRYSDEEIMLVNAPCDRLIAIRSPFQRSGEAPECWLDDRDMWQWTPDDLDLVFTNTFEDDEWTYKGMFRDVIREIVGTRKATAKQLQVLPQSGYHEGRLLRSIETGK